MRGGSQGSVLRSIQTLFGTGSATGMSDRQLLEQFLARRDQGEDGAFAALVARHGPLVWSVCRGISSDSHAAEDAFQATFLILVRKAGSIRRREMIGPWLHGVARRVAVRARKLDRARRRQEEHRDAEMKAGSRPDASPREDLEALHEEIDRLPEKYRVVVALCHLEGRTHAEAARLLGCPIGTVNIRAARARELLRARLTRRGLALAAVLGGEGLLADPARAAMPPGLAESTIAAAMHLVSGRTVATGAVPAAVAQLTEGVLRTMTLKSISIAAALALTAGSAVSGIAWHAMGGRPVPTADGAAAAVAPAEEDQDGVKARERSVRNLKAIALGLFNFTQIPAEERFPPAAIRKDGKPLLSWRVAILPFLDQQALYEKFHLDEPWNSPHNRTLLNQMPEVYAPVVRTDEPRGTTYYQVFTGRETLFEGERGPRIQDVKDGISNTLMVVEAGSPVPWTKPEDIAYDAERPLPKLGRPFNDGFHGAFADCSVLFFSKGNDPEVLRRLITSRGGEYVGRFHPGNVIEVIVKRDGQDAKVRVTIGTVPREEPRPAALGADRLLPRPTPARN